MSERDPIGEFRDRSRRGRFTWSFGPWWFIETDRENYIWSDPEYGGDDSFAETDSKLDQWCRELGLHHVYKGEHGIDEYTKGALSRWLRDMHLGTVLQSRYLNIEPGKTSSSPRPLAQFGDRMNKKVLADVNADTLIAIPIVVWSWAEAPEWLRAMSDSGGDEDWVAVAPPHLADEDIPWLEAGSRFGCCDVQIETLEDGSKVHIGSHA